MRVHHLFIAAIAAFVAPAEVTAGTPGTAYCFGVGCPCDNDDPTAGCQHSLGYGALLTPTGTTSIAANDLSLVGTNMPKKKVTLTIFGTQQIANPFYDGLLCVGGQVSRLPTHLNSGDPGTVQFDNVVGLLSNGPVPLDGLTLNFQLWFRDAPANQTPCGLKANTSNAYQLTFTP